MLDERPTEHRTLDSTGQGLIGRVQDLAIDVELALVGGGIAHPYGPRIGEPRQPGDSPLLDAALPGHAIYDLHLAGIARHRPQEPLAPSGRLIAVADAEH